MISCRGGASNEYPQDKFSWKNMKNINLDSSLIWGYIGENKNFTDHHTLFDLITTLCTYDFSKLLEKLAVKHPPNNGTLNRKLNREVHEERI